MIAKGFLKYAFVPQTDFTVIRDRTNDEFLSICTATYDPAGGTNQVGNIKITFRSPTEGGGATADPSSRGEDR